MLKGFTLHVEDCIIMHKVLTRRSGLLWPPIRAAQSLPPRPAWKGAAPGCTGSGLPDKDHRTECAWGLGSRLLPTLYKNCSGIDIFFLHMFDSPCRQIFLKTPKISANFKECFGILSKCLLKARQTHQKTVLPSTVVTRRNEPPEVMEKSPTENFYPSIKLSSGTQIIFAPGSNNIHELISIQVVTQNIILRANPQFLCPTYKKCFSIFSEKYYKSLRWKIHSYEVKSAPETSHN